MILEKSRYYSLMLLLFILITSCGKKFENLNNDSFFEVALSPSINLDNSSTSTLMSHSNYEISLEGSYFGNCVGKVHGEKWNLKWKNNSSEGNLIVKKNDLHCQLKLEKTVVKRNYPELVLESENSIIINDRSTNKLKIKDAIKNRDFGVFIFAKNMSFKNKPEIEIYISKKQTDVTSHLNSKNVRLQLDIRSAHTNSKSFIIPFGYESKIEFQLKNSSDFSVLFPLNAFSSVKNENCQRMLNRSEYCDISIDINPPNIGTEDRILSVPYSRNGGFLSERISKLNYLVFTKNFSENINTASKQIKKIYKYDEYTYFLKDNSIYYSLNMINFEEIKGIKYDPSKYKFRINEPYIKSVFVNGSNVYIGAVGGVYHSSTGPTGNFEKISIDGRFNIRVHDIEFINGNIYLATNDWIYFCDDMNKNKFIKLDKFPRDLQISLDGKHEKDHSVLVTALKYLNNNLYVGTKYGFYHITNFLKANETEFVRFQEIKSDVRVDSVVKSDNSIFIGTGDGLYNLSLNNKLTKINEVQMAVSSIKIVNKNIYLKANKIGNAKEKLFLTSKLNSDDMNLDFSEFVLDSLGSYNDVLQSDNIVFFAMDNGLYSSQVLEHNI